MDNRFFVFLTYNFLIDPQVRPGPVLAGTECGDHPYLLIVMFQNDVILVLPQPRAAVKMVSLSVHYSQVATYLEPGTVPEELAKKVIHTLEGYIHRQFDRLGEYLESKGIGGRSSDPASPKVN